MTFTVPESVTSFLDKYTLGWCVRKGTLIAAIVLPVWATWGTWFISTIKARADEAVVSTMKVHGIDSESFKEMQGQLKEAAKAIHASDVQQTVIQGDIASVKQQNREILELLTKGNNNE